jgi:hypothetical protein
MSNPEEKDLLSLAVLHHDSAGNHCLEQALGGLHHHAGQVLKGFDSLLIDLYLLGQMREELDNSVMRLIGFVRGGGRVSRLVQEKKKVTRFIKIHRRDARLLLLAKLEKFLSHFSEIAGGLEGSQG